jgi:catechol 2,3-dioxygenase-like lactoylglutathione lyase family enzyme
MPDAFKVSKLDHIEIFVPDRRAAAAWYGSVLGLKVIEEYEYWSQTDDGPLMVSAGEGTKLALFAGQPQGDAPIRGHKRVAFLVSADAMLSFIRHVETLDLPAEEKPVVSKEDIVDHKGSFSIYFDDPWGNAFELTAYDCERMHELLSELR